MPSVIVGWSGTCTDRDVQEELIAYLSILAAECRTRRERPEPKRPAFLEKIVEINSAGVEELPHVIIHDGQIDGNILIDSDLARAPNLGRDEATVIGMPQSPSGEAADDPGFFKIATARLRGIDFRLFDPRGIYPLDNRMSFVFLGCPDVPALDGRLARIVDRRRVTCYQHEAIRAADWFATNPSIHLRYYLEEWSDQLFAWIKCFFIPDLTFWRYETLPGYDQASALLGEVTRRDGRELAKQKAFKLLVEWFNNEADEWTATMTTW